MSEDTQTPSDHYYGVYGHRQYAESNVAYYDVMDHCINECALNPECIAAAWYTEGGYGTTGTKCKMMHRSHFNTPPVDNVRMVNDKMYIPIIQTTTTKRTRHFVKNTSVQERITDNGDTLVRFDWMTSN